MSRKVCTFGADGDYQEQNGVEKKELRPTKPVVPAKDEVYVFIRARNEHFRVMKNFMVRESKIIENYKGTIVGLAEQVFVVEAPECGSSWISQTSKASRYCVLVIRFDSLRNANLWSFSDPIFKQQDCLRPNEAIEGFIVPLKHLPPEDCRTFTLMNIRNVRNPEAFQTDYIDKMVPVLNAFGLEQGVVSTDENEPLRRSWVKRGDFIFVHQCKSEDDMASVFNSDVFTGLKEKRMNWADCETLVFTVSLDPLRPRTKKC